MKDSIEYTRLSEIFEDVCEPYKDMLVSGRMTFSEFAVMENILIKMNTELMEEQLDVKGLTEENNKLKKENEELKEKIKLLEK